MKSQLQISVRSSELDGSHSVLDSQIDSLGNDISILAYGPEHLAISLHPDVVNSSSKT